MTMPRHAAAGACQYGGAWQSRGACQPGGAWWRFTALFAAAALGLGLSVVGFVAAMDPYGLRAAPGRAPGPIMDGNQRFMYPQVVRGGAYDAAVFGTSTARLLDPADLDRAFPGTRFANLAMNAATPFEQVRLARLFLARSTPRAVVFGLDAPWCGADAEARRLTFRPFPPWLYEAGTPYGTLRQVNWQSLTTAGLVALHRLGRAPARIRGDGFSVFTPPESAYDAGKAVRAIHGGAAAVPDADAEGERTAQPVDPVDAPMPALAWLDGVLADLPSGTPALLAFMPVHVAAQGLPGTRKGAREAACKAAVAEIGRRRGATVVDFRIPSPVTTQDANYWDALHYRLPIAARIVAGLAAAATTDDPAGFYRVLARP